jgi:parvulin-like peptidyl-prolyl isomerase
LTHRGPTTRGGRGASGSVPQGGGGRRRAACRCLVLLLPGLLAGATGRPAPTFAEEPDRPAAIVDGTPVHQSQVDLGVARLLSGRPVSEEARWRLQAEVLEHLVNRHLVLAALERRNEGCSEQELDLAMSRLTEQLARQDKSLARYLEETGQDEQTVRRAWRWELTWPRYVSQTVTDDVLRRTYDRHRRELDGTRLRVAHILLPFTSDRDGRDRERALAEATRLRDAINSGSMSFAAAARHYSQAPTAAQGGTLGWISRQEPMPESFSREAFRLNVGEVGKPVISPAGVHLIQCLEVEPGTKSWEEARESVVELATRELFEGLADEERSRRRVEYTGVTAYFRPGTGELVMPTAVSRDGTRP